MLNLSQLHDSLLFSSQFNYLATSLPSVVPLLVVASLLISIVSLFLFSPYDTSPPGIAFGLSSPFRSCAEFRPFVD